MADKVFILLNELDISHLDPCQALKILCLWGKGETNSR